MGNQLQTASFPTDTDQAYGAVGIQVFNSSPLGGGRCLKTFYITADAGVMVRRCPI